MTFNERTMAAVREHFSGGMELEHTLQFAGNNDHLLMIASEGIGKHVENVPAGIYANVDDVVTGHDWSRGVPEFVIDLTAEPAKAVLGIDVVLAPNGGVWSLTDFGIDYEEGDEDDGE